MQKKYGKSDELYKCSDDGVYFYTLKSSKKMMPFYTIECPKCNSLICWFCSKNLKNEIEFEYCCLRRLICLKIFKVHNEEIYRYFDSFDFIDLTAILPYSSLLLLP